MAIPPEQELDQRQSFPSSLCDEFRAVLTPPIHPFLHQPPAPSSKRFPWHNSHLCSSSWLSLSGVAPLGIVI